MDVEQPVELCLGECRDRPEEPTIEVIVAAGATAGIVSRWSRDQRHCENCSFCVDLYVVIAKAAHADHKGGTVVDQGSPGTEVAPMQAAVDLVAAFGSHDVRSYFDGFAPEATFLFHAEPTLVPSRAAYETLWHQWESEGFHVVSCRSVDPRIDMITDDVAVFTHRVQTRLVGEADEQRERETIIFRREPDGRWLGIHEHLSVDTHR